MLSGAWWLAASPVTSLVAGTLMLAALIRCGYHRDKTGAISRRRVASVFIMSAATYTFTVAAVSELVIHGPPLSVIFSEGFGNQRVAWLLLGVILDGLFRIWDEFRHP